MNDKGNYEVIDGEGYFTIKVQGNCDFSTIHGLEETIMKKIVEPHPHIIVACDQVINLSSDWIRLFLKIQSTLKQHDKQLGITAAPLELKKHLKKEGLESSFKFYSTPKEALVAFGLEAKKSLDTEFINPFLNATLHVLKVQAGVEAKVQKIYLKKNEESLTGDVSGIIGIVSDSFKGSVIISFPEKTFLSIMSGMLGETYTELTKDILDGAGEITNMIFGQAKTVLNEKGYGIKIALPSVVSGKDHSLSVQSKGTVVVIPFHSNSGNFFVEICLSN